jgi:hypothetical protein
MSPADHTTRRDFLRATAAGAAGLALGGDLRAATTPRPAGTAKSCIFINLVGGPSHLDTFDPKPDAPSDIRGPFRPIPTRVPDVSLSELFPKLAGMADKFSLIRSMHHDAPPIHEAGFQLLNTGRLFRDGPEWPAAGVVACHLTQPPRSWGYQLIPGWDVETGIGLPKGQWFGFLAAGQSHVSALYPGDYSFSTREPVPYDLGEMYQDAVRFVEQGGRFANLNAYRTVFDAPSWDCHADRGSLATDLNDYRDTVAPTFDSAFSALLTDLETRGLLDATLVVATGEFGRTPFLNANGGRDHWANCWTALVAGGGVKGGRVVGASDRLGGEPKDRPVTPQELVATIFHALGVAPDATIPGPTGAPVAVYPGRPVAELF